MPPSYSRRRPKSRGDIVEPTHRTSQDAVTGEVVRVELDAVQVAYERVRQVYDQWRMGMSPGDLERLADAVMVMTMESRRHRERDVDALRALLAAMNGRGSEERAG
jgi:hypothetical protein